MYLRREKLWRRLSAGLLAAACLLAACPVLRADGWTWRLPPQRYKKMNLFERGQYDKAVALFQKGNYKAAVSEFEKFRIQFDDSQVLSHIAFMKAYSHHLAKNRHTAIKGYKEVLDFFGDQTADAAPAIYFMAEAYRANGDNRNALRYMKEMVEHKKYQKHPLAAAALQYLAQYYWGKSKPQIAVGYWKQIYRDFARSNSHQANLARGSLVAYYVNKRDYAGYEAWLAGGKGANDPNHRRWVVEQAWNYARHGQLDGNSKAQTKTIDAFYKYFKSRKVWFDKTDRAWGYWSRLLEFLLYRKSDKKVLEDAINKCLAHARAIKDVRNRDAMLAWVIDSLRAARKFNRARHCLAQMADRTRAAFKEYEILSDQGKWPQAVAQLQRIEKMPNKYWAARAQESRAWIYKERLHDYNKAIQLYRQISKPPGTLWQIQDCYYRQKKLNQALTVLTEIENSFPSDAPRAAWTKASYLDRAGQKKKAIAQARRILKLYRKSQEASAAHQLLEKYGIATGGGVSDEE